MASRRKLIGWLKIQKFKFDWPSKKLHALSSWMITAIILFYGLFFYRKLSLREGGRQGR